MGVGYCATISWAIFRAPTRFFQESFRNRWKFLFVKFRPSIWWWSLILFAKSLSLSLTMVLFTDGAGQMAWLACTMLLYTSISSAIFSWRTFLVVIEDVVVNTVFVFLLLVLTFLVRWECYLSSSQPLHSHSLARWRWLSSFSPRVREAALPHSRT